MLLLLHCARLQPQLPLPLLQLHEQRQQALQLLLTPIPTPTAVPCKHCSKLRWRVHAANAARQRLIDAAIACMQLISEALVLHAGWP